MALLASVHSVASAQGRAHIAGQVERIKLQKVYFVEDRGYGENVRIDSAMASEDGSFEFRLVPRPTSAYRLELDDERLTVELFLSDSDDLLFRGDSDEWPRLVLDRLGANKDVARAYDVFGGQSSLYNYIRAATWKESLAKLATKRTELASVATQVAERWKQRPRLAAEVRTLPLLAVSYVYPSLVWRYAFDDSSALIDSNKGLLVYLDTMRAELPALAGTSAFESVVSSWENVWLEVERHRSGDPVPDSDFARMYRLPADLQGEALIAYGRNSTFFMPVTECLSSMEPVLQRLERSSARPQYIKRYRAMVDRLHSFAKGVKLPHFAFPTASNDTVSLDRFKGQIVYLDFWGTWCGPCREELPALKKLYQQFKDSVIFVSVALESENWDNWKDFLASEGLPGTQLYAEGQFHNPQVAQFDIRGVPTYMIVDREGRFYEARAERPSSSRVAQQLREALREE
jgi:thiol-disulfide isomerase/thioredoxin